MKKTSFLLLFAFIFSGIAFSQSNFQSQGAKKSKEIKELLKNYENTPSGNLSIQQFENTEQLKSPTFDYGDPPVWNWVNQFGGSGKDLVSDIVTDAAGNIYLTGHFSGEITIESNTYSSTGKWDGFIAKLAPGGSLTWFKQLSSDSDEQIRIYGISLDDSDNIYVTGYYTGTITLDGITLPDLIPQNLFFAKLNTSGDITMAKNHGITNYVELGRAIDIDGSGNIYIVGSRDGYNYFNDRSIILKYNASGSLLMEIEHDQNFVDLSIYGENVYFAGRIISPGYIGDFYFEPNPYGDMFLAKSDLFIIFEWAYMAEHQNNGDSYSTALYIAEDENIYITGGYRSDIILGGNQISNINSGFIAKCTPSGVFMWVNQLTNEPHTQFYPMSVSGNDNIIFASYRYANSSTLYKYEVSSYNTSDGDMINVKNLDNNVEKLHYSSASNNVICSIDKDENISISEYTTNLTEAWNVDFEGNSAKAWVLGMNADHDENFYIYGYASNTINFYGTEIEKGLFLAKISSAGYLFWIKQFPDAFESKSAGSYSTVDVNSNSVYITGTFYETLQIPGEIPLEPDPDGSIFLIKYSLQGEFQWAMQENIEGWDLCLTADYSGNILVTGTFNDIINIGNTSLTSAGSSDAFISKYNQNGEFDWAIRAGGEDVEYSGLISSDGQNNTYLTGEFLSVDVTVKDFPITLNEGDGNILVAKIDPAGNPLWVNSKAGSLINNGDYYCWPTSIKTDVSGNTYIKGRHADSTYFDNILLTNLFNGPDNYKRYNSFITKLDTDGNTIWAKTISGRRWGYDYNQMDIDADGSVYFGSQIRDTLIFGEYFTYINSGYSDLFVAKYTNDGELDWVKAMESQGGSCYLSSVAVNDVNSVIVAGSFRDYLNFGNTPLSANNENVFVTLFGDYTGIKIYDRKDAHQLFELFPNPAQNKTNLLLKDTDLSDIKIVISDIAGRTIFKDKIQNHPDKIEIDISEFSRGVYLVKVQSKSQSDVKKLIID